MLQKKKPLFTWEDIILIVGFYFSFQGFFQIIFGVEWAKFGPIRTKDPEFWGPIYIIIGVSIIALRIWIESRKKNQPDDLFSEIKAAESQRMPNYCKKTFLPTVIIFLGLFFILNGFTSLMSNAGMGRPYNPLLGSLLLAVGFMFCVMGIWMFRKK